MFSIHIQDGLLAAGLGVLAAIGLGLLYGDLRKSFLKKKKGDLVEFPDRKRDRKAS